MLDDIQGGRVVQNALFKIAAKQCLRLSMMFDFDAQFCHLILTLYSEAMFKTLDDP